MANRHDQTSEDPTAGVTHEDNDIIFVAVGKDVKECKSILLWALQNSGGNRICILHVHQPAQYIPFMGGKAPASSLQENIVREHHETERQKMHKIMDEYLLICRQMGARAQKLITETSCIEKGIVELISQNGIKKLVMGAAAEKQYRRKMMDLKSNKAKYVCAQAPVPCRIQFICKGHLIFTREATETGQPNPVRSMSVTLLHDNTETGQSNYLRSRSVTMGTIGYNRDRGGTNLAFSEIPKPEGTEELSSPKSRFFTPGGSFHLWDLPITTSPDLGSSAYSSKGVVDETLPSWNLQGNENGLEFGTLSLPSGYSRSSSSVNVTSSLQPPIPSLISSPSLMSTSSSSGAHSVVEGSLDNILYEQLRQAMAEAEKEALKRRKAEREMIEAIRWVMLLAI